MTAREKLTFEAWLTSDDETKRRHAAYRLDYEDHPENYPVLSAVHQEADPWLPLIRACPDHNPGCCAHPAAFCTRYNREVLREDCIACLTADGFSPEIQSALS